MSRREKIKHELERIVRVLIVKYHPDKIILFGSVARGRIHKWSDIDLVIVKKTRKRIYDRIGEVVHLCKPEIAVDFIVYNPQEFRQMQNEEPFVRDEIVNKGKILYEAE